MAVPEAGERMSSMRSLATDLAWMTAPDYTPDEWPVVPAEGMSHQGEVAGGPHHVRAPAPDIAAPSEPERPLGHAGVPSPLQPGLSGPEGRARIEKPAESHPAAPRSEPKPWPVRPAPTEVAAAAPTARRRTRWSRGFGARRGTGGRDYEGKLQLIRTPAQSCHRVAVVGLKGGVGRTSVTIGLGGTLAQLRCDRVVALDASPDGGTLGQRVSSAGPADLRDLLRRLPELRSYMDLRPYIRRTAEGLEVLAGGAMTERSGLADDQDYRRLMDLLSGAYPLVITDSGTGLFGGGLHGVLDLADRLVLCATPGADAAESAAMVLDWLVAHGRSTLAEHAILVISRLRDAGRVVNVEQMAAYFEGKCGGVCVVPHDEHLAAGGELSLDLLRPRTRAAFVDLAAMVGQGMRAQRGPSSSVREQDDRAARQGHDRREPHGTLKP